MSATKKFSPSDRAVLLLPNNSLQWTQMKYIFKVFGFSAYYDPIFLESFYISSTNSRKWILAIFINNYFRLNIYCFTINTYSERISCWVFRPHTNWGDKLFCRAECDIFARPLIFAMCRLTLTLLGTKQHQHTQLPWSSLATIGRGLKSSTPTTSSPIQATRVLRPSGHTKKLTRTKWGTWEDLCM